MPNKLHPFAFLLGLSGLIPQLLALGLTFSEADRAIGLASGFFYAALIFSFLGGLWWGVAAANHDAPTWIYAIAVVPTLIAFATGVPWMTGTAWPGPSLLILSFGLLATPFVDWRLKVLGMVPANWMKMRIILSIGLGVTTLILATRV